MTATTKVKFRRLDDLKPDPENARVHSPAQVEQIAASIRRFGWTAPILVDDVIRAGNGRYAAAEGLYAAGETIYLAPGKDRGGPAIPDGTIPAIDCSGWSAEERTAYALADNRIAENASWNDDLLRTQLDGLASLQFDLDAAGFDMGSVTMILASGNEANDPLAHWEGMPEFDQQDKRPFRSIPVHFSTQADVDKFAAATGLVISDATRYLWFPETPIERYADKQYEHAGE